MLLRPHGVDSYQRALTKILDGLTYQDLRSLVHNAGSLAADKLSHKICLISRNNRYEISDDVNVQLITKFVESQLVICLRNLQFEEQIDLYNRFACSPSARGMTGPLFEAYCQLRFQTEIFIPMVRLPDSETKPTRGVRPTEKKKAVEAVPERDYRH